MTADQQRTCPTLRDKMEPRFAHRISVGRCQDQQRACFHKCYSCEWNNSYQAQKALEERTRRPSRSEPEPEPVQAAQVEPLPELPELAAQFVLSTTE